VFLASQGDAVHRLVAGSQFGQRLQCQDTEAVGGLFGTGGEDGLKARIVAPLGQTQNHAAPDVQKQGGDCCSPQVKPD
jgi:hypothetical protein